MLYHLFPNTANRKVTKTNSNRIIGSDIFKFVIGPNLKEYKVHGTAISRLSKPLGVLINGEMREAKEKCVNWPDIDEKTFVRFTQWAYTKAYVTEEPEIPLDPSFIRAPIFPTVTQAPAKSTGSEKLLYSLVTADSVQSREKGCCWNRGCAQYGKSNGKADHRPTCLVCRKIYVTTACPSCDSVYTDCPTCGPLTSAVRNSCSNTSCRWRNTGNAATTGQLTCLRCLTNYSTKHCGCLSAFTDCGACAAAMTHTTRLKRSELVNKFLDESGTKYPTTTSVFSPRKNTEGCEDYTGVFLCHAKLYIVADTYDIPALKQLSLHRLHATLKEFTLYPSRFNDIAALAKYVFENTRPEDKIRDMITLYYACIIDDARNHDGLKSLIEEIPDFAFGLISKMSERLA